MYVNRTRYRNVYVMVGTFEGKRRVLRPKFVGPPYTFFKKEAARAQLNHYYPNKSKQEFFVANIVEMLLRVRDDQRIPLEVRDVITRFLLNYDSEVLHDFNQLNHSSLTFYYANLFGGSNM